MIYTLCIDAEVSISTNESMLNVRIGKNLPSITCKRDCHAWARCTKPVVIKDGKETMTFYTYLLPQRPAQLHDIGDYRCRSTFYDRRSNTSTAIESDTLRIVVLGKNTSMDVVVNHKRDFDQVVVGMFLKYKKRLLLRCIHHFIPDLINNMDDMRISGTEPSSVILSQTK